VRLPSLSAGRLSDMRQAALVLTKPAEVGILMQALAAGACLPSRHPRVLLVARRACIYATSAPSIMFAPCCRPALREPPFWTFHEGRRLTMRAFATPVTRVFGRSTNRLVVNPTRPHLVASGYAAPPRRAA
jgi:hypothetical protein